MGRKNLMDARTAFLSCVDMKERATIPPVETRFYPYPRAHIFSLFKSPCGNDLSSLVQYLFTTRSQVSLFFLFYAFTIWLTRMKPLKIKGFLLVHKNLLSHNHLSLTVNKCKISIR